MPAGVYWSFDSQRYFAAPCRIADGRGVPYEDEYACTGMQWTGVTQDVYLFYAPLPSTVGPLGMISTFQAMNSWIPPTHPTSLTLASVPLMTTPLLSLQSFPKMP